MQSLQKEYTGKGVVWLTICSSDPGKQGHYSAGEWQGIAKRRKDAGTAIRLDGDGTVGRAYGPKTTPHVFLINPVSRLI